MKPRAIVCLGATAAQSFLGRQFKVTTERGLFVKSPLAPLVLATVHPSSILRAQDDEKRREELETIHRRSADGRQGRGLEAAALSAAPSFRFLFSPFRGKTRR